MGYLISDGVTVASKINFPLFFSSCSFCSASEFFFPLVYLAQVASYKNERSKVKEKINDDTFNNKPSIVTA